MLDKRFLEKTQIYKEFDEVESQFWFDFKKSKFLHNIDTFYYSVKFVNDFTNDTIDRAVKHFRSFFEQKYKQLDEGRSLRGSVD